MECCICIDSEFLISDLSHEETENTVSVIILFGGRFGGGGEEILVYALSLDQHFFIK